MVPRLVNANIHRTPVDIQSLGVKDIPIGEGGHFRNDFDIAGA